MVISSLHSANALPTSKTVIIASSYAPSIWLFRAEIIDQLCRRGYRVLACAPPHQGAYEKLRSLGAYFCEVGPRRTSRSPLADIYYAGRLVRLLRREQAHALISYTAKPVIWGGVAVRFASVRNTVAIITGLGYAFTGKGARYFFLRQLVSALYRVALRRYRYAIFQNPDDHLEFTTNGMLNGKTKSFVVNGSGVDLKRFEVATLPREPIFLLIARLIRDKGIQEYCEAALRVKQRYPEAQFRIVGWFDKKPSAISERELKKWCEAGIEYRGAVEDVRPEIASSRVFVLPSYREGTPRTVLEAMAMGRPVITTDVPGCRETVRENWNGFKVAVRDPVALARAMERFLVEPKLAELMGANSRMMAETKYDAQSVARAVLAETGLD